jgi:hypothetical protein
MAFEMCDMVMVIIISNIMMVETLWIFSSSVISSG